MNHGISEGLMDATFAAVTEFFDLPDTEKKQYEAKSGSDPIKCGNFNFAIDNHDGTSSSKQSFTLWRDYLTLLVHPEFHCPHQPPLLRYYKDRVVNESSSDSDFDSSLTI